VDTHTASKLIAAIHQMNSGSSFIIISHRISALSSCDRIYILKNGRINHSGSHAELIETSRFYGESFRVQQFEEEKNA
jgi:ABC-type bacteriocin/lantibiotic exporter with double-glycine peptidase domain